MPAARPNLASVLILVRLAFIWWRCGHALRTCLLLLQPLHVLVLDSLWCLGYVVMLAYCSPGTGASLIIVKSKIDLPVQYLHYPLHFNPMAMVMVRRGLRYDQNNIYRNRIPLHRSTPIVPSDGHVSRARG